MNNILFASRHALTEEQVTDAKRLWGDDCEIVQQPILFTDVQSVKTATADVDVLIAVLPQHLAFRVGAIAGMGGMFRTSNWARKVWTAESKPVPAADGAPRMFTHVAFHQAGSWD